MMYKNSFVWLSALAAVQGVSAELPPHIAERLLRCQSNEPNGPLPCDIEQSENINALADRDKANATDMAVYRDVLLQSKWRVSQKCCLKCKKENGIHSVAEDEFWNNFYSEQNITAWSSAMDAWAKDKLAPAVPDPWTFLQRRLEAQGVTYPVNIKLEDLELNKTVFVDEYCPELKGYKPAPPAEKPNDGLMSELPVAGITVYATNHSGDGAAAPSAAPNVNSTKFTNTTEMKIVLQIFVVHFANLLTPMGCMVISGKPAFVNTTSVMVSQQIATQLDSVEDFGDFLEGQQNAVEPDNIKKFGGARTRREAPKEVVDAVLEQHGGAGIPTFAFVNDLVLNSEDGSSPLPRKITRSPRSGPSLASGLARGAAKLCRKRS